MSVLKKLYHHTDGVSAIEVGLIFPILITMLVSIIDAGNAFLCNQKLINAAHTMADLITREANPTYEQRDDAVIAAQEAIKPFSLDTFEYNVTSFQFVPSGSPVVIWEQSNGLTIGPSIVSGLSDLGAAGEGVVVVRVAYIYRPFFTGFAIGEIEMDEYAYMRGRRSAVVGAPL